MKKFLLPVLILVFILLALGVTLFLVRQRQEVRKNAAPATVLTLSPATLTKQVNDTFTVTVNIDTGTNNVSAAEIHVNYPAATLEGISITPGSFLTKVLPPGANIGNGTATIILGNESISSPAVGQGVLATITFKVLQGSSLPVKITLDPATQVAAFGDRGNVVSSMSDATLTIGTTTTVTTTPTLTPSPTNPPQSTATITTTPTTTPIPTNTEEENQDTSKKPTDTPTSTPTNTPTPTTSKSNSTTFNEEVDSNTSNSEQNLIISNPGDGQIITDNTPVIKGKAKPGATIVITIRSEPQTVTVTADENGNWQITPPSALEDGNHTLIATSNGEEVTTEFTVGLPETASFTPTMLFLSLGGILLLLGTLRLTTL